jgi:hypothetical protein
MDALGRGAYHPRKAENVHRKLAGVFALPLGNGLAVERQEIAPPVCAAVAAVHSAQQAIL